MPKQPKSYIGVEIEWLEQIVREYREYIDSYRPFKDKIEDRTDVQPNAKGVPIIKIIATKEDTIKALMIVLKEMPSLMKSLDELREKRAVSSLETRGDVEIPGMMKGMIEERT